jgi:hypothetical protein
MKHERRSSRRSRKRGVEGVVRGWGAKQRGEMQRGETLLQK